MLLCPIHHDVIDSDIESYTVGRLQRIKSEHEKSYSNGYEPSDDVANSLLATISISYLSDSSLLIGHNQSGGQLAHQITNFILTPNAAAEYEREVRLRREAHDTEIFRHADEVLNEDQLHEGSGTLLGGHYYLNSFYHSLINFSDFLARAQNQYLHCRLASLAWQLVGTLRELQKFLAYNFFVYPANQGREDNYQLCLYPDLCLDRAGSGTSEEMATYDEYTEKLDEVVNKVSKAYVAYRRAIKEELFI